ncbi:Forkhead box protein H1 [Triplophysa tibetana]|uniref:Forkhead box protein H1 n=1 Tax=Triplophysa tibetana TaxID=1572043 RepID=A0A5A9NKQ7_9TELE|nr:Forkhead box protein H1 [Triplophysa tibetana]
MQRQHSDMVLKRKYKRYSKQKMTYLGLIAYVIQNAAEKRLTFCELMNEIGTFVIGDRKGLENNIRVCLSLNDCFVKVPINPECPNARRNFWKLDESKITPKMLRRHFNGMRDMFPDIYGNSESSSTKNATANKVKGSNGTETEQKFNSSFSIESILQRESSAPTSPAHLPRTFTNACPGLTPNGDYRLACKRKTWDYQDQMQYDNFRRSYPHFSFPSYCLGQTNEGCSLKNPPSKRMCTAPELSHNYTAFNNTRQFTSNSVAWAYL